MLTSDKSSTRVVQQAAQEHMLFRHLNTNLKEKLIIFAICSVSL